MYRQEPNGAVAEPPAEKTLPVRPSRTVNDFGSAVDLVQALASSDLKGLYSTPVETGCALCGHETNCCAQQQDFDSASLLHRKMEAVDEKLDWVLENYDPATTKPQSMEEELRRLIVLKSFLVLDTERKEAFEEITLQAKNHFQCPIALISLVDLGRQWFLSNRGLGDVRETPRKLAFCAHAIQSSEDCFVVTDASKDPRFCDSALVTGPPDIRFYAGSPLITEEGYKLGTICIIDKVARPGGLSAEQKLYLKDLADKVLKTLLRHRKIQRLWFKNLTKTGFPEYEAEEASDEETTSVSEDNDLRDLVVGTIDRCLQNIAATKESISSTKVKDVKQTKHVRFVARDEVHPIESIKSFKELWWNPEETHAIRTEVNETVRYYRKHRPRYKRSVEIVAKGIDDDPLVEKHMTLLSEVDDNARGLESNIVRLLKKHRMRAVEAVLKGQSECRYYRDDVDETARALRSELTSYSRLSKQFVVRMGKCDEASVDQRRCNSRSSLSRWSSHSQLDCSPKCRSSVGICDEDSVSTFDQDDSSLCRWGSTRGMSGSHLTLPKRRTSSMSHICDESATVDSSCSWSSTGCNQMVAPKRRSSNGPRDKQHTQGCSSTSCNQMVAPKRRSSIGRRDEQHTQGCSSTSCNQMVAPKRRPSFRRSHHHHNQVEASSCTWSSTSCNQMVAPKRRSSHGPPNKQQHALEA